MDPKSEGWLDETKVLLMGAWDVLGKRGPMLIDEIARLRAEVAEWKAAASGRTVSCVCGKAVPSGEEVKKALSAIDDPGWRAMYPEIGTIIDALYAAESKSSALSAERGHFEKQGIELCHAYGNALIKAHDDKRTIEGLAHELEIQRGNVGALSAQVEAKKEILRRLKIIITSALPGKEKARLGDWNKEVILGWFDDGAISSAHEAKPLPLVLYCPRGHQHIDEGEWSTKPHKTHQCQQIVVSNEYHADDAEANSCMLFSS